MNQTISFEIQDENLALSFYKFLKGNPEQYQILDSVEDSGAFLRKKTKSVIVDITKVTLPALITGIFSFFAATAGHKDQEPKPVPNNIVVVIETDKGEVKIDSTTTVFPNIEEVSKIKVVKK